MLGLDLNMDSRKHVEPGSRPMCGVLTCEERSRSTLSDEDSAGSSVSFSSVSSMSVFKKVSSGSSTNTNEKRGVLIATVTSQDPNVTHMLDDSYTQGFLAVGRAKIQV